MTDETKRPQIYCPRCAQEQTQQQLLRALVQRAFDARIYTLSAVICRPAEV